MSKFSTKKLIITGSIFVLVLIMSVFGVTFAIFNFTKTGQANTMSTSTVLFDFSDVAIDVANDFPQDGSISIEDLTVSEQTAHTGELTISGHNTLTNGVKYNIYLLHGDDIIGKTRLNDENIKFQLVPNFTSGTNGFTVLSNDYANPTNLLFDNEGKALISTGLIKDTSQLTTVSYAFHMWIDGGGMNISSTTKRATLAEGNPSLADATEGNTTATRYMRNDATEASTVTLFPAKTNQVGKTIYTTYEFSNGYYNVKFLVEAMDAKSGYITLSSESGSVDCDGTTTFAVTSHHGGPLSCTSSDTSKATCSVSGTTVTVNGVDNGSASITVTSGAIANYNVASTTYTVTTSGCPSWHYLLNFSKCSDRCLTNCQYNHSTVVWSCVANNSVAPSEPYLEPGGSCWCKY